jgi:hypothetical protein
MSELRILEGLIAFLLILPLLKPFFKKLDAGGLVLLPLLGLGMSAAVFPVYGFRLECVPLLGFALFETLRYFPSMRMLLKDPRYDTSLNDRPLLSGISVILLAAVTALALCFAPVEDAGGSAPEAVTRQIADPEGGPGYTLRIYGSGEAGEAPPESAGGRPLMVLIPPRAGSLMTVDRVCRELWDRGFTVISYSRGMGGMTPPEVYGMWSIHRRGHLSAAANARGRALETERREEARFLLSLLRGGPGRDPALALEPAIALEPALAGADFRNIFLAGYGAGGGALMALASSPGFRAENPGVRGIISVEGPLFSAFQEEAIPPPPLPGEPWYRGIPARAGYRISRLMPKKMAGPGPALVSGLPLLCIVSDRALEERPRNGRYAVLFAAIRAAREPAVLAAVSGAGPLDYSDLPETHPLYRRFFPGGPGGIWKNRDFAGGTASLMANFATLFLESPRAGVPAAGEVPGDAGEVPGDPGPAPPETGPAPRRGGGLRRTPLGEGVSLEHGGVWNFYKPEDILGL